MPSTSPMSWPRAVNRVCTSRRWARERPGSSVDQSVTKGPQFDAFLECGILAHGFLRVRCADCGHDEILAFSCKRRGFSYCGARHMASALCLTDGGLPTGPENLTSLNISWALLLGSQSVPWRAGLASLRGRAGGHPTVQLAAAIDEDAGALAGRPGAGLCTARQAPAYLRKRWHRGPQWNAANRPPGIESPGVLFAVAAPEHALLVCADCPWRTVDRKHPRKRLLRLVEADGVVLIAALEHIGGFPGRCCSLPKPRRGHVP